MGIKRISAYIVLSFLLGGAFAAQLSTAGLGALRDDNQALVLEVVSSQVTVTRLQKVIDHMTIDEVEPDLLQPGIVCDTGVLYMDGIISSGTDGPYPATLCRKGNGYRISNPMGPEQAVRFIAGLEAPEASPIH